jgi:hypothetical protein
MAYAKGQAREYAEILPRARSSRVNVVMPQICVMEAFKAWERERASIVSLTAEITTQIREMRRREAILDARRTAAALERARLELERQSNMVRGRIFECCDKINGLGSLIAMDTAWVGNKTKASRYIEAEPDDMIIGSILLHAATWGGPKAFLSENTKDFRDPSVAFALDLDDVTQLFSPQAALGWIADKAP